MTRLLLILFAITLFLPQTVFAKSNIDKARDYAKIEKNSEARQLLDQAILDDPLDADVHYKAGLVYGQLGMNGAFDLAMKNACKLKSSYCPKVAEPYYNMAFNDLNRGSQRSAIRSLEKAFAYQPAKMAEALSRLLTSGKGQLSHKNRGGAEMYFSVLTHFDLSYRNQVSKLYFDSGQNATSGEAIEYYRLTSKYSDAYKKQIGDDLASMAKDNKYSDQERSSLKREAGKYLTDVEMSEHFPPDYKIYQKGTYTFTLKPGESVDHWIRFASGVRRSFKSEDYKYIIKYRDNSELKAWNIKRLPHDKGDIKFIAVTAQTITMKLY